MLHTDLSPLTAGLPPSILAAAAGRAARLAGISVTDLLEVDAAHEKASIVTAVLDKVQQQYEKKKAASRDRRSAARKAAPSVVASRVDPGEAVASAAQAISQISIVGAEPERLPPPPTPSPPPSPPPAKAPPRPSRAPAPASSEEESEASEEEEEEEEESEEEPPPPPARALSRAPSRPAAAPKKAANATRARWGL